MTAGAAINVDGSGLSIAEPVTLNGTGTSGGGVLRNLANNNTLVGRHHPGFGNDRGLDRGYVHRVRDGGNGRLRAHGRRSGKLTKSTGAISGTGGMTQTLSGTLNVTVANTYTGATNVNAGTLKVGVANAIGASSALTVASGAVFDMGGFGDTVGSLAGAGSVTNSGVATATLSSGGSNASTSFSGVASDGAGLLALTKTGTGTLTLSGNNTYTGLTTLSAGVLAPDERGSGRHDGRHDRGVRRGDRDRRQRPLDRRAHHQPERHRHRRRPARCATWPTTTPGPAQSPWPRRVTRSTATAAR